MSWLKQPLHPDALGCLQTQKVVKVGHVTTCPRIIMPIGLGSTDGSGPYKATVSDSHNAVTYDQF